MPFDLDVAIRQAKARQRRATLSSAAPEWNLGAAIQRRRLESLPIDPRFEQIDPAYVAEQIAGYLESIASLQLALEQGGVKPEKQQVARRSLSSAREIVHGMLDQYAAIYGDDAAAQVAYAAGFGPYPSWLAQQQQE